MDFNPFEAFKAWFAKRETRREIRRLNFARKLLALEDRHLQEQIAELEEDLASPQTE